MWEPQQPSLRMITQLLLLTSVLLPTLFTIRSVNLTLEPSNAVSQGTNVMVRCQALVSSSWLLNREYTIYKDNTVVYTRSTTTTEDLLYSLRMARVANTGKYECKVNIQGKELSSNSEKLTVTGLQTPVLSVDKRVFSKGEEVTVWCCAPEESGAIVSYFYKDSKDLYEMVNANHRVPPDQGRGNEHSGTYYCKAINYTTMVQSQPVTVDVKMAMWKKCFIVACCLLVVAVLVLACVLCYNSKRDAAPPFDGMEGRATNGTQECGITSCWHQQQSSATVSQQQCRETPQREGLFWFEPKKNKHFAPLGSIKGYVGGKPRMTTIGSMAQTKKIPTDILERGKWPKCVPLRKYYYFFML